MPTEQHFFSKGIKRTLYRTFWAGMRLNEKPWYIRYGLTVLFIFVATVLKFTFFNYISVGTPFLLYFGVVLLSARFGGVGPSIFAAIVSAMVTTYFFLPPYNSFDVGKIHFVQVLVYTLECLLIAGFSGALIKAEGRIKRSEKRFRALIEKGQDAISMAAPDGTIYYVSPSVQTVLGYTPDEFRKMNGLENLHPEEAEDLIKKYQKLGESPGLSMTLLHRYKNKEGEFIWVESTLTNLLEDNNVRAIVSNFRNVTERVVLEKQKDDFIGIATHELKTPVTSVKAYAQLLISRFKKEGNDKAAEIMERMDKQLNKLIGLITDLLDVTKIQSGTLPFVYQPYDFTKLVSEVVEELQRTTERHNIEITHADMVTLTGDRERVGQVLSNLISNAIKYSPLADRINVSVTKKDKDVEVCVEDYGVGIDKKAHTKVFERFYRVSGPGNNTFPGLGLGLYISSEIIKRQAGRIWVQSEKGKGSTFCFSLPLQSPLEHKNANEQKEDTGS